MLPFPERVNCDMLKVEGNRTDRKAGPCRMRVRNKGKENKG